MQLSEIETKLKSKRKILEKENTIIEKSRNKITSVKNEIVELEKQIISKKTNELLSLINEKKLTIDEVIELVSSYKNIINKKERDDTIIEDNENGGDN